MDKTTDKHSKKPRQTSPKTKEERLADALRANLRRRKAGKGKPE